MAQTLDLDLPSLHRSLLEASVYMFLEALTSRNGSASLLELLELGSRFPVHTAKAPPVLGLNLSPATPNMLVLILAYRALLPNPQVQLTVFPMVRYAMMILLVDLFSAYDGVGAGSAGLTLKLMACLVELAARLRPLMVQTWNARELCESWASPRAAAVVLTAAHLAEPLKVQVQFLVPVMVLYPKEVAVNLAAIVSPPGSISLTSTTLLLDDLYESRLSVRSR